MMYVGLQIWNRRTERKENMGGKINVDAELSVKPHTVNVENLYIFVEWNAEEHWDEQTRQPIKRYNLTMARTVNEIRSLTASVHYRVLDIQQQNQLNEYNNGNQCNQTKQNKTKRNIAKCS